jgi:hypothetical protein
MPNNARTQADGTWIDGYTTTPADWEDLERKIQGSWNGDRGGAYLGVDAFSFGGSGFQVTGPARLTRGGGIIGPSGAYKIRDGAWPLLSAGHGSRSRKIVQPFDTWYAPQHYLWSRNHAYHGVGSTALACRTTYGRIIERAELYAELRVVNGATLTKVDVYFRVAQKRTKAPVLMPKFRIMRVPRDAVTSAPEPLKSTADGTGFDFLPLVTTPSSWYLDGAVQVFSYVCDQNNVIDVENYTYIAHLYEEQGVLSPDDDFDPHGITFVERKANVRGVVLSTTALTGSVTQNDGTSTTGTTGDRFLVVDPDTVLATGTTDNNSCQNGIWTTAVGAWARATDLDTSDEFSPNWIVQVLIGSAGIETGGYEGTACWQCEAPSKASKIDITTAPGASNTKTQIRMVPAVPRGNIWHSMVPYFEVSDLRWQ